MLRFTYKVPHDSFLFFKDKYLHELNINELALAHLTLAMYGEGLKDGRLSSSLFDLQETLQASFNNVRTNQYVPLMTSFAILDQLGALYGKAYAAPGKSNGIKCILKQETNLSTKDIDALIMLRNGVLHNGSLSNISIFKKNTGVLFRTTKKGNQLLTHSSKPWDGIYRNDLKDYLTIVDLILLRNLTAEVKNKCYEKVINNTIHINEQDPMAFYYKYLFLNRTQKSTDSDD